MLAAFLSKTTTLPSWLKTISLVNVNSWCVALDAIGSTKPLASPRAQSRGADFMPASRRSKEALELRIFVGASHSADGKHSIFRQEKRASSVV